MRSTETLRSILEPFVREALGCACPDRVFDAIRIEQPAGGLPEGWLIGFGGRLLLLVAAAPDRPLGAAAVRTLLQQGRALRDARGYHRFRLVLPAAPEAAGDAALAELLATDGRLHLHRLPAPQLAALGQRLRAAGR